MECFGGNHYVMNTSWFFLVEILFTSHVVEEKYLQAIVSTNIFAFLLHLIDLPDKGNKN